MTRTADTLSLTGAFEFGDLPNTGKPFVTLQIGVVSPGLTRSVDSTHVTACYQTLLHWNVIISNTAGG